MKLVLPPIVASWRARTKPWQRQAAAAWRRHLGWPAWGALALLTVGALLQWQLRPQLLHDQASLHARARVLDASQGKDAQPRTPDPLHWQALPTPRQRGRDLEWLILATSRNGVKLDRADYAVGAATSDGVTRVEATLPLVGTYGDLRRYIADVLNELPHSALESIQIERPNAQSRQLQATARLVLFYREETP